MEQLLLMVQVFLLGVVSWSHYGISGSVLAVTVRPGDNITLHCDCKLSTGTYTVWFRNCSHENQPTLVLSIKTDKSWKYSEIQEYSHYKFVKNSSSDSYDLLIVNVTESDEGIYYCGTEETTVEQEKKITPKVIYRYSNTTTRLTITDTTLPQLDVKNNLQDCGLSWKLLFSLCPAVAFLSALFSSLLVYKLCQKTETQDEEKGGGTRSQRRETQGEDVCYAALEIQPTSQRPKRKSTTKSSDYSTYSAINTSRA